MWQQLFRTKSVERIQQEAATGLTDAHGTPEHLRRVLGVRDLTFMGIAAVVVQVYFPLSVLPVITVVRVSYYYSCLYR